MKFVVYNKSLSETYGEPVFWNMEKAGLAGTNDEWDDLDNATTFHDKSEKLPSGGSWMLISEASRLESLCDTDDEYDDEVKTKLKPTW